MEKQITQKEVSVISTGYNKETGDKILTRMEVIKMDNGIFRNAKTDKDIKAIYEWFWNTPNSESRVLVDYVIDGKVMTKADF